MSEDKNKRDFLFDFDLSSTYYLIKSSCKMKYTHYTLLIMSKFIVKSRLSDPKHTSKHSGKYLAAPATLRSDWNVT